MTKKQRKQRMGIAIAFMALSLSQIACGQDEVTKVTNSPEGLTAIGEASDIGNQECGLDVLWQQIGEEAKVSFLTDIKEDCIETGQEAEWTVEWDNLSTD